MTGATLHLTFDDGPDPIGTPAVLAALAAHGAIATFFLLGAAVRRHPQLVAAIASAGHRVELHGDAHLDHRQESADDLRRDTDAALASLVEHGVEPSWWRLPWGRPGPATQGIADRRGLRIVGWDVDTRDWRGDGPPPEGAQLAAGDVVLLHDGFGPGATRSDVSNTIALVDDLASRAAQAGLTLSALSDPRPVPAVTA